MDLPTKIYQVPQLPEIKKIILIEEENKDETGI